MKRQLFLAITVAFSFCYQPYTYSDSSSGTTDDYIYVLAYAVSNKLPPTLSFSDWKRPDFGTQAGTDYIGNSFDSTQFKPAFKEFTIPDPQNPSKFITIPSQNLYRLQYFVIKPASNQNLSQKLERPLTALELGSKGLEQAPTVIEWRQVILNNNNRSTSLDQFLSTPISVSIPYPEKIFYGMGRYQFVVDSLNGGVAPYIQTVRKSASGKNIPYITFITYPIKIKRSTYERIS